MTVKLSISVPDDVAAYLHGQGNASAAVIDAVRRVSSPRRAGPANGKPPRRTGSTCADGPREQVGDDTHADREQQ